MHNYITAIFKEIMYVCLFVIDSAITNISGVLSANFEIAWVISYSNCLGTLWRRAAEPGGSRGRISTPAPVLKLLTGECADFREHLHKFFSVHECFFANCDIKGFFSDFDDKISSWMVLISGVFSLAFCHAFFV